jgi:hypothetical protein
MALRRVTRYHAALRSESRCEQGDAMNKTAGKLWALSLFLVAVAALGARVNAGGRQSGMTAGAKEEPFVVEYYYKTKWGHADEFLTLFKKNHYPVLKKEMELGRILRVSMAAPRLHASEDGRWDYRVTIVFKSAAIANDNFDSEALTKQLYPDQDTYKKEEQRRFEILEGHTDVPIKDVVLEKR